MGLLNFLRLKTPGTNMNQVEQNQQQQLQWDLTSVLMFASGLYSLCSFLPAIEAGMKAGQRWVSQKLWRLQTERKRLQYREILSHDADMLFETPSTTNPSLPSLVSPLNANTLQVVYPSRNVPTLVDGHGLNEIFGGPIPHPWTIGNTFVERAVTVGHQEPAPYDVLPSNLDVIEVFNRAFRLERWMNEFPVKVDFSTLYSYLTKELQIDYMPGGRCCIEVWSYDSNGSRRCRVYEPGDEILLPLSRDANECPFRPVTVTADATFFILSSPDFGEEKTQSSAEESDDDDDNGSWELGEEEAQGNDTTQDESSDESSESSSDDDSEESDESEEDEETQHEEEEGEEEEEEEKVEGFYSLDATSVFMAWAMHKVSLSEMNKILPFIIREMVSKDPRLRDIFYTPSMDVWAVRLSVEYSDRTSVTFLLDQRGLTEYKRDKEGIFCGIKHFTDEEADATKRQ